MGKRVNQAELALIMGVSDVTIWEWQKAGMPMIPRAENGLPNEYDTSAVIAWKIERELLKVRAESPRDELYREQTRLTRLQIAEKEKTLVPVADVEPEYTRMVMACRQRLLQMVGHLPEQMEAAAGVENKRALLEDELIAALQELARYDPTESREGAGATGGDALGASVTHERGPVGGGQALPQ